MGNSCNSKTNKKIKGLAVDARAPDGSWQNADGVQAAPDPADPKKANDKVLTVKIPGGPEIYRYVMSASTATGRRRGASRT